MARRRKSNPIADPNQLLLFTQAEMSGEGTSAAAVSPVSVIPHREEPSEEETSGGSTSDLQAPEMVSAGTGRVGLMVSVMRLLKGVDSAQIGLIAMQTAALMQGGIDFEGIYHIPSLPGISFRGDMLYALAYVSIARSFPSMTGKLGFDWSSEYQEALLQLENS